MKKIIKLFVFTFVFIFGVTIVNAQGSASLSVNRGTIENGSSVTASVTVSNTAAWNITITSSGSTSGCTQKFVGDSGTGNNTSKTFSVTCKSTSTGIINFTMSGDITSSDGANTKISGSKQVTVTVPREKSTNNKLKSLSVEGYEITPEFKSDVNEYSLVVPSTVEKITINATKADSYASIDGTGEKDVEEGLNTFEIVVTSETGVSNIYIINVTVEDINPIEVNVDGKKYTLVKVAKNLEKPELFDETTVKISDIEIPAFVNEASDITLVGLKDEKGSIKLFIYKDGKYEIFNDFGSDKLYLIFLKPDKVPSKFVKSTIKINESNVDAYKVNNKYVIYALNISTGKKNFYTYEQSEKTFQIFNVEEHEEDLKNEKTNKYLIYGLSGALLFLFILLCLSGSKSKKLKKYILNNSNTTINNEKELEKKESHEEVDEDFKDLDNKKRKRKKKKDLED